MSGNPIYDYISSAAVSLTMAGNAGISPFLTLLLLGVIEMANPELLNMGETMEMLLASWWSIGILGLLAIGEMMGKCIPAVDEVIDSVEVFVVPVVSILATMATMGLLPMPEGSQLDAGQGQKIDAIGIFDSGDGFRNLQEEIDPDLDPNYFGEGFMTFTKFCLVTIGIGLSLAIHFFKMLVRVSSLVCSGGCCQPCITIIEYVLVVFGVILAILAPAFAIVASIVLLVAAGYIIRVKCCKKKENSSETTSGKEDNNDTKDNKIDVENQSTPRASTAEFVNQNPNPPAEAFAVADLVDVPLPPPMSPELDVEAKTY
jgi:hypothetical protein